MSTITFYWLDSGGGSLSGINTPEYGYTSEIHMAFTVAEHETGYGFWDNGAANDYRICTGAKFNTTAAKMTEVSEFFRNGIKGRGQNFVMGLGSGTGFYPFGPDKNHAGDYTVRLLDQEQSGLLTYPFRYMDNSISMLLAGAKTSTTATLKPEGSFQIGTVTGLRWPEGGIKPVLKRSLYQSLSYNGTPSAVDVGQAGDVWECEFELVCNYANALNLVKHLVETVRTNDVAIVAPDWFYLFGADKQSGGTYTAKLLTNVIKVTHEAYDKFSIPLKFWFKAVA